MATYNPAGLSKALHGSPFGNRVVFNDKTTFTTTPTIADVARLCAIAGGTLVDRVVIKNPDLDSGTQLTGTIGFVGQDGTVIDIDYVQAAGSLWRAAATTVYDLFPPILMPVDAWLVGTITATSAGNTGTVEAKVEGEMLGIK